MPSGFRGRSLSQFSATFLCRRLDYKLRKVPSFFSKRLAFRCAPLAVPVAPSSYLIGCLENILPGPREKVQEIHGFSFSFSSSGIPGPLSLFNRLSVLPSGVESILNKDWRRRRRRGQWRRLFSLLWERGRREATAGRGSNLELYFSPSPNVLLHFKELFFRTAHKVYAVAYIVGASVRFRPLALASRPYVHQKPLSQSPCIALI